MIKNKCFYTLLFFSLIPFSPLWAFISLDNISLSMRGILPTASEREDLKKGKDLMSFADQFKGSKEFQTQLIRYWLSVLKISKMANPMEVKDAQGTSLEQRINASQEKKGSQFLYLQDRCQKPGIYVVIGDPSDKDQTLSCSCDSLKIVSPHWDPSQSVPVCPGVLSPNYCGDRMSKCVPLEPRFPPSNGGVTVPDSWLSKVIENFTVEPAAYLAHLIIQDKPWSQSIASTDTVMTGAMVYFLQNFGQHFLEASPPASQFQLSSPQPQDFDFKPVTRQDQAHAGVLTTYSYHFARNGWRARSVGAMDAFLCKRFVVPEGAIPLPSEETELSRRPYCSICHQTLEPLSYFFSRWANVGALQAYFYSPTQPEKPGMFREQSGKSVADLAQIFVKTDDFSECIINRSFDFIVGRSMSDKESVQYMPKFFKIYKENNGKVWPVMRAIIGVLKDG